MFSKVKLRKRGNPYEMSLIDSIASFYDALRSDRPVDERQADYFGRDVIGYCEKIIQASRGDEKAACSEPVSPAFTGKPSVLVIGASGFIGRELIRRLLASGRKVRAMMRSPAAVLEDLAGSNLEVVRGDIRNADA